MKEVIYRDGIKQMGGLLGLAQQATSSLEDVLGPSAELVTAEWDRSEDVRGRSLVLLRLSDFTGSATATFEPWELESATHMRSRLHRLWGDLLQVRSHQQLQELIGRPGK